MPLYQLHQVSSSSISAQFKSLLFCFLIFGIRVPRSLWCGWFSMGGKSWHSGSFATSATVAYQCPCPELCSQWSAFLFFFFPCLKVIGQEKGGGQSTVWWPDVIFFSLFVSWGEHWFSVVVSFLQCLELKLIMNCCKTVSEGLGSAERVIKVPMRNSPFICLQKK